ncbi:MAG: hypothetical protein IT430_16375 [Phycisphaerales bacterium]|nr:hypothetical protein [Phycisphaerales bacterium]
MTKAIRSVAHAAGCTMALAATAALAQRYDITYLEFPPGFSGLEIGDINNRGDVVGTGYHRYSTLNLPFLWRDGEAIGLPILDSEPYGWATQHDNSGAAWGINELGQIVGTSEYRSLGEQAVLWPGDGRVTRLFDSYQSRATAINDLGVIVGSNFGAFRLENGVLTPLAPLSSPGDINNRGQIIGRNYTKAVVWENGRITSLPSLGGSDWANDINDAGQIVGSSGIEGFPVIWENGEIRQLPHFGIGAWAISINESGDMAGQYFIQPSGITVTRACIWRHNLMMDLNDLLTEPLEDEWYVWGDTRINDSGQIGTLIGRHSVGGKPVRLEPVDTGLTLWGIDPSRPGRRNTIEIHHVSPNGRVILLWGTTRSEPQPFEQCSGAMIDLADPRLAAVGVADANGVARITLNVPANVEGNYIFQAVDHTTCEVSPPAWALFKMVN